ncbi:hypothetical protein MKW94_018808, partial [Papaver nudicaule]|nr:hypothetical protein [Papaver nudicaule]
STIRDKIIPHAVSWYTGEASQVKYYEAFQRKGNSRRVFEDSDDDTAKYPPFRFLIGKKWNNDLLVYYFYLLSHHYLINQIFDEENIVALPELDMDGGCCTLDLKKRCYTWPGVLLALETLAPNVRERVECLREIQ